MELILRHARILGAEDAGLQDLGIAGGRIAAVAPDLAPDLTGEGPAIELGGRLVAPALVESHIHLDKSRIIERCSLSEGTLAEAVATTAAAKRGFTEEDIYERARRTLEQCIVNGTGLIRTQVEIDPGIGLRGLAAIRALARDYAWAAEIEIVAFPQEGVTNKLGTEELLAQALRRGARVLGGAPYTDSDPPGQLDRLFALARAFDVDLDLHLDLADTPEGMLAERVCELTERFGRGGRVAIGHATQLSTLPGPRFGEVGARLAAAGVAVTVLPATDLHLMGRRHDHDVPRGVAAAHRLVALGVNCSLATNNVLNPFTPYGDGSLIRMANLYANCCHAGRPEELALCFAMIGERPARLMRRADYGIAPGCPADLVVLDAPDPAAAVAGLAQPVLGFHRGRLTFTRALPELHPPGTARDAPPAAIAALARRPLAAPVAAPSGEPRP